PRRIDSPPRNSRVCRGAPARVIPLPNKLGPDSWGQAIGGGLGGQPPRSTRPDSFAGSGRAPNRAVCLQQLIDSLLVFRWDKNNTVVKERKKWVLHPDPQSRILTPIE